MSRARATMPTSSQEPVSGSLLQVPPQHLMHQPTPPQASTTSQTASSCQQRRASQTWSPRTILLWAGLTTFQKEDLTPSRLYPPLSNIREISVKIATKVAKEAYENGTASTYPEPEVN